jgi:outer membrane scaffolding protein for murein synthesis (MipA/OmpV family)
MQHARFITAGAALLALGVTATPVMAYEELSPDVSKGKAGGFIGLGATYAPDYEGGDDYEARIAPFGKYERVSGRYASLGGTSGTEKAGRVKANLIAKDQSNILEFGPLLQYRLKRDRDSVDNNKVQKLPDIDAAIEAGAFIGLNSGPWSASVSYVHDITSVYKGDL